MSSFSDLRKIGIIPTRMGTRLSAHNALRHLQDHPHAYGDKFGNYTAGLDKKGSSPRVWGQGFYLKHGKLPFRIIPTRMGTSIKKSLGVMTLKDHPHAYGDKVSGCSC